MTQGSDNKNWSRYRERVARVIEFIHKNPGADLDNDTLAEVAHLSTCHWHRIYRAITGETAVATVRRARMNRAASELLRTDRSIADIGASVGYPEIHSFTRSFKAFYGLAPGQFRASQIQPQDSEVVEHPSDESDNVNVSMKPDTLLFGHWHRGDYNEIPKTFEIVMTEATVEGLVSDSACLRGVYFQDPDAVAEAKLTSFAGVAVNEETKKPELLEQYRIPGGSFAILTHRGPYAMLHQKYHWLYSVWLPASGCAVRDEPCYEVYLNSPVSTDPADLLTEICLPVT